MITLAILLAATIPARSPTPCTTYWMDLTGSGAEQCLQVDSGWPLAHFKRNHPYWHPMLRELQWYPIPEIAKVEPAGAMNGHHIYRLLYAPQVQALVWERTPSSYSLLLLLDGNETVVAAIDQPSTFIWNGREVVEVRLHYSGTGAFQQSLFFAWVHDEIVYLVPDKDAVSRYLQEHGIQTSHRGGGFCVGTLIWENWAWQTDRVDDQAGDTLRATYAIQDHRLILESAALIRYDTQTWDCEGVLTRRR